MKEDLFAVPVKGVPKQRTRKGNIRSPETPKGAKPKTYKPRKPKRHFIMDPGRKSKFMAVRPVEITLTKRFSINCVYYGPGRIRVGVGIAATLLEMEQRAKTNEAIFNDKERARIIVPGRYGYRSKPVPADAFYENWTGAPVAGQISGKDFPSQ